jgi:hypothetical protein
MEFGLIHDVMSFGPLLDAVLSMHAPYPAYNPPGVDDRSLAPDVDPTVYPICAGQWQLSGYCQLHLDRHDIPIEASRLLETFMNEFDPKQTAKDIAYSVLWEIQASDDFTYTQATMDKLKNDRGFTVHFVCSSDLASRDRSNPDRDARALPGRILRHSNPRIRVDCGGSIAISVTTGGISIDYKHRPIHQKAAVQRVDEDLKQIIRTKQFASARELRRYLQHDLRDQALRQYTSAQLYFWWAFYNKNDYCLDENEFISSELLLADRRDDGFNIIPALIEHDVSLAWTTPFWNDDVVDVPTSKPPVALSPHFPLHCHHISPSIVTTFPPPLSPPFALHCHQPSPSLPLTWLNQFSQRNLCGCDLQNQPAWIRTLLRPGSTDDCFFSIVLSAS